MPDAPEAPSISREAANKAQKAAAAKEAIKQKSKAEKKQQKDQEKKFRQSASEKNRENSRKENSDKSVKKETFVHKGVRSIESGFYHLARGTRKMEATRYINWYQGAHGEIPTSSQILEGMQGKDTAYAEHIASQTKAEAHQERRQAYKELQIQTKNRGLESAVAKKITDQPAEAQKDVLDLIDKVGKLGKKDDPEPMLEKIRDKLGITKGSKEDKGLDLLVKRTSKDRKLAEHTQNAIEKVLSGIMKKLEAKHPKIAKFLQGLGNFFEGYSKRLGIPLVVVGIGIAALHVVAPAVVIPGIVAVVISGGQLGLALSTIATVPKMVMKLAATTRSVAIGSEAHVRMGAKYQTEARGVLATATGEKYREKSRARIMADRAQNHLRSVKKELYGFSVKDSNGRDVRLLDDNGNLTLPDTTKDSELQANVQKGLLTLYGRIEGGKQFENAHAGKRFAWKFDQEGISPQDKPDALNDRINALGSTIESHLTNVSAAEKQLVVDQRRAFLNTQLAHDIQIERRIIGRRLVVNVAIKGGAMSVGFAEAGRFLTTLAQTRDFGAAVASFQNPLEVFQKVNLFSRIGISAGHIDTGLVQAGVHVPTPDIQAPTGGEQIVMQHMPQATENSMLPPHFDPLKGIEDWVNKHVDVNVGPVHIGGEGTPPDIAAPTTPDTPSPTVLNAQDQLNGTHVGGPTITDARMDAAMQGNINVLDAHDQVYGPAQTHIGGPTETDANAPLGKTGTAGIDPGDRVQTGVAGLDPADRIPHGLNTDAQMDSATGDNSFIQHASSMYNESGHGFANGVHVPSNSPGLAPGERPNELGNNLQSTQPTGSGSNPPYVPGGSGSSFDAPPVTIHPDGSETFTYGGHTYTFTDLPHNAQVYIDPKGDVIIADPSTGHEYLTGHFNGNSLDHITVEGKAVNGTIPLSQGTLESQSIHDVLQHATTPVHLEGDTPHHNWQELHTDMNADKNGFILHYGPKDGVSGFGTDPSNYRVAIMTPDGHGLILNNDAQVIPGSAGDHVINTIYNPDGTTTQISASDLAKMLGVDGAKVDNFNRITDFALGHNGQSQHWFGTQHASDLYNKIPGRFPGDPNVPNTGGESLFSMKIAGGYMQGGTFHGGASNQFWGHGNTLDATQKIGITTGAGDGKAFDINQYLKAHGGGDGGTGFPQNAFDKFGEVLGHPSPGDVAKWAILATVPGALAAVARNVGPLRGRGGVWTTRGVGAAGTGVGMAAEAFAFSNPVSAILGLPNIASYTIVHLLLRPRNRPGVPPAGAGVNLPPPGTPPGPGTPPPPATGGGIRQLFRNPFNRGNGRPPGGGSPTAPGGATTATPIAGTPGGVTPGAGTPPGGTPPGAPGTPPGAGAVAATIPLAAAFNSPSAPPPASGPGLNMVQKGLNTVHSPGRNARSRAEDQQFYDTVAQSMNIPGFAAGKGREKLQDQLTAEGFTDADFSRVNPLALKMSGKKSYSELEPKDYAAAIQQVRTEKQMPSDEGQLKELAAVLEISQPQSLNRGELIEKNAEAMRKLNIDPARIAEYKKQQAERVGKGGTQHSDADILRSLLVFENLDTKAITAEDFVGKLMKIPLPNATDDPLVVAAKQLEKEGVSLVDARNKINSNKPQNAGETRAKLAAAANALYDLRLNSLATLIPDDVVEPLAERLNLPDGKRTRADVMRLLKDQGFRPDEAHQDLKYIHMSTVGDRPEDIADRMHDVVKPQLLGLSVDRIKALNNGDQVLSDIITWLDPNVTPDPHKLREDTIELFKKSGYSADQINAAFQDAQKTARRQGNRPVTQADITQGLEKPKIRGDLVTKFNDDDWRDIAEIAFGRQDAATAPITDVIEGVIDSIAAEGMTGDHVRALNPTSGKGVEFAQALEKGRGRIALEAGRMKDTDREDLSKLIGMATPTSDSQLVADELRDVYGLDVKTIRQKAQEASKASSTKQATAKDLEARMKGELVTGLINKLIPNKTDRVKALTDMGIQVTDTSDDAVLKQLSGKLEDIPTKDLRTILQNPSRTSADLAKLVMRSAVIRNVEKAGISLDDFADQLKTTHGIDSIVDDLITNKKVKAADFDGIKGTAEEMVSALEKPQTVATLEQVKKDEGYDDGDVAQFAEDLLPGSHINKIADLVEHATKAGYEAKEIKDAFAEGDEDQRKQIIDAAHIRMYMKGHMPKGVPVKVGGILFGAGVTDPSEIATKLRTYFKPEEVAEILTEARKDTAPTPLEEKFAAQAIIEAIHVAKRPAGLVDKLAKNEYGLPDNSSNEDIAKAVLARNETLEEFNRKLRAVTP